MRYNDEMSYPSALDEARARELNLVTFMNRVYVWMTLGLTMTAVTAWITASMVQQGTFQPSLGLMGGLIAAELGLVFFLSLFATRMPPIVAMGSFALYSILTGVTFSFIFLVYSLGSITTIFLSTAALFGTMAIFGTITKKDLTTVGRLCFMGLVGIVLAIVIQWVAALAFGYSLTAWDIPIAIIGVIVFLGLTAYDSQKIRQLSDAGETATGLVILGALILYLDFINLFLFLLRLFGSRD